ncbi:MAG: hypothetical protein PHP93_03380 [Kiritimatiellales bacterium]|nr:hypothetical protein [Kiritimatiellales bacterium]
MNDPFTISGENWQQIEKLEEIRLAYSERCKFSGQYGWQKYVWKDGWYQWVQGDGSEADRLQNNIPAHGKGFNLQTLNFWSAIQVFFTRVESMAWLNDAYQQTQHVTFKQFCQRAGGGLYTSETDYGFRRVIEYDDDKNPVFRRLFMEGEGAYENYMEPGDIIGPWVLEDILLALSVPLVFGLTVSNSCYSITKTTKTWSAVGFGNGADQNAAKIAAFNDGYSKAVLAGSTTVSQSVTAGFVAAGITQTDSYFYPSEMAADAQVQLTAYSFSIETVSPANLGGFYVKAEGFVQYNPDPNGIFAQEDIDLSLSEGWQVLPSSYAATNPGPTENNGPSEDAHGGFSTVSLEVVNFRLFFNYSNMNPPPEEPAP